MIAGSELIVSFVGDERVLAPGDELTFGRSGDLVIDENRYLHRVLGRFTFANGLWWLVNVGSSIPLTVSDTSGPSFARVSPGSSMALSFESSLVAFEAGNRNYELAVDVVDGGFDGALLDSDANDEPPEGWSDEVTTTASSLPMSAEQRLLLIALAEGRLRDPGSNVEMPTNRQIAHRLGWTITKYNRKLDGLCSKFAAAGVSGLRGSSDALAKDRRLRLVEHALHAGTVSAADLALLP